MGSLFPNTFLNSCYSSNAQNFSATAPDDSNTANQPGTYHNCGPQMGLHISPCTHLVWKVFILQKTSGFVKVCKFIPFYKHTHMHARTHTHTHTHTKLEYPAVNLRYSTGHFQPLLTYPYALLTTIQRL